VDLPPKIFIIVYISEPRKSPYVQTTALNYKLIKKIKDERFDEEALHQYKLYVHLGTRDLQVLVLHGRDVMLVEDYVFPVLTSNQDLMQVLDQLYDAHALLKAGFWSEIRISIKNNKFVQVPRALFVEESVGEYLKFNANADPQTEDFLYTENARAEAVTVFAIHKELKSWLEATYPNKPPIFLHQSSGLIEGVLNVVSTKGDDPLYIYVDRFKLHIIATKNGKLLYYNQFVIKQFSDYIRYIMLVMKSLNMDQKTSQVMLWGYIGKNSPHYHEFYKYINNVVFGARPTDLQFGYIFDELQDHHFFDLYSINLAAS
jgi:hypothetical protein